MNYGAFGLVEVVGSSNAILVIDQMLKTSDVSFLTWQTKCGGRATVFSERYYGELMGLEGDVGGKRVVVRNRKDVAVMRVVDGREVMDVDVADGRR